MSYDPLDTLDEQIGRMAPYFTDKETACPGKVLVKFDALRLREPSEEDDEKLVTVLTGTVVAVLSDRTGTEYVRAADGKVYIAPREEVGTQRAWIVTNRQGRNKQAREKTEAAKLGELAHALKGSCPDVILVDPKTKEPRTTRDLLANTFTNNKAMQAAGVYFIADVNFNPKGWAKADNLDYDTPFMRVKLLPIDRDKVAAILAEQEAAAAAK